MSETQSGPKDALARFAVLRGGGVPVVATVVALAAAALLSSLLIATTGGSPSAAFDAIYQGSMASSSSWSSTLLYAAPLLLVASGSCISNRAGMFNIGQEGQVLIGALFGGWAALRFAVQGPLLAVLVVLFAGLGGAIWAGLCALMYRFRGVNIVVSTLLMTFIAEQVVAYAVQSQALLQETRIGSAIVNAQSNPVPADARLDGLGEYPGLQVNYGLLTAVAVAALLAFAVARTRWGFRLKMVGLNPTAAQHAGVRIARFSALTVVLSGLTAGLAGAVMLASPVGTNRLQPGVANNIGWDGLLVALVARNRPVLCVPVALLFGVLRSGGSFLASTGVPFYLADVIKGLLVLAFVVPSVVTDRIRARRTTRRDGGDRAPRRFIDKTTAPAISGAKVGARA